MSIEIMKKHELISHMNTVRWEKFQKELIDNASNTHVIVKWSVNFNDLDHVLIIEANVKVASQKDTLLQVWLKDERELHIKIMGKIQVEILESIFKQRFDLDVSFGDPIVIYKETPTKKGEGYEEYTLPKPCWAVVRFDIEPLERGSGAVFGSCPKSRLISFLTCACRDFLPLFPGIAWWSASSDDHRPARPDLWS